MWTIRVLCMLKNPNTTWNLKLVMPYASSSIGAPNTLEFYVVILRSYLGHLIFIPSIQTMALIQFIFVRSYKKEKPAPSNHKWNMKRSVFFDYFNLLKMEFTLHVVQKQFIKISLYKVLWFYNHKTSKPYEYNIPP